MAAFTEIHRTRECRVKYSRVHENGSVKCSDYSRCISIVLFRLCDPVQYKTLPTLEDQIKAKLQEAERKLKNIGIGVPDSDTGKLALLIDKLKQFTNEIIHATQGEEDVANGCLKLFTTIRRHFYSWEHSLKTTCQKFQEKLRDDMDLYENQYRGRELTGFINYRSFETILREQIIKLEVPAVKNLKTIAETARSSFSRIALDHFMQYPHLHRVVKSKIEAIGEEQEQEAEKTIRIQIKMEKFLYCQDDFYGSDLKQARDSATFVSATTSQSQISVTEMSHHVRAYLKGTTYRLSNQIPLIIQYYVLHGFADRLQSDLLHLLQDRERLNVLLQERQDLSKQRQALKDRIQRLNKARQRLAKFPDTGCAENTGNGDCPIYNPVLKVENKRSQQQNNWMVTSSSSDSLKLLWKSSFCK
ncbi:hypothetical protein FKM82_020326 [Ascaphus truei]